MLFSVLFSDSIVALRLKKPEFVPYSTNFGKRFEFNFAAWEGEGYSRDEVLRVKYTSRMLCWPAV